MSSFRARPVLLGLLVVLVAGCGGGSGKLPAAGPLLRQSANAMRAVTSLSLAVRTQGRPQVRVESMDAKLLRNGNSKGSLQITEFGLAVQLDFVVLGKTVYLKGLTGGWQREPLAKAAGIYDPSAVLDPNRGIVQLLLTATGGRTEKREKAAGQDCYRVHATLARAAVARLVPGVSGDTPAEIWIAESGRRVLKSELEVPAQDGGKKAKVTIAFADFGTPFAITAPA